MADKVARVLNFLGADRDLLNSADSYAFLDLIDEYLDDPEGIATPVNPIFLRPIKNWGQLYVRITRARGSKRRKLINLQRCGKWLPERSV